MLSYFQIRKLVRAQGLLKVIGTIAHVWWTQAEVDTKLYHSIKVIWTWDDNNIILIPSVTALLGVLFLIGST